MVLSARNFSNSEAYLYLIGRLDRKYVSKLMEAQVAVMKENIHKKVIAKGNDVWLGENAWIDNLDEVIIGNNVCISQGALLLTGNHDYTLSTFDYRNAPIIIEDGAWIGAKTVVCPGIKVKSHAILTVGSTATKNMEAYGIYQGNPALKIRTRNITL